MVIQRLFKWWYWYSKRRLGRMKRRGWTHHWCEIIVFIIRLFEAILRRRGRGCSSDDTYTDTLEVGEVGREVGIEETNVGDVVVWDHAYTGRWCSCGIGVTHTLSYSVQKRWVVLRSPHWVYECSKRDVILFSSIQYEDISTHSGGYSVSQEGLFNWRCEYSKRELWRLVGVHLLEFTC